MTIEQLEHIVKILESKADRIKSGFYGSDDEFEPEEEPDTDFEQWQEDCREAARLIRERKFSEMKPIHFEEIECSGAEEELLEEFRREANGVEGD
jgi:hypothetical protein